MMTERADQSGEGYGDGGVADGAEGAAGAGEAEELALVARLRSAGPADRSAWGPFVERYQRSVYLTCLRYTNDREDAADLTQDAFVQAIRHIGGFDGRSRVSTWLTRIAINLCLSHRRSQRLRKHRSLDASGGAWSEGGSKSLSDRELGASVGGAGSEKSGAGGGLGLGGAGVRGAGEGGGVEHSPEARVEQGEAHAALYAALADLPEEQRALLVLRDVRGLEYEQIAEVLGVALGTVKSRLFRARVALKEAFEARSGV